MFFVLLLATWGSPTTVIQLIDLIDDILCNLPTKDWANLHRSIQEALTLTRDQQGSRSINPRNLPEIRTERTAALLCLRLKDETRKDLFYRYLVNYKGEDPIVLRLCQQTAIDLLSPDLIEWVPILDTISRSYMKNVVSDPYYMHRFIRVAERNLLPGNIAEIIASNPDYYPAFLVKLAEARCRDNVGTNIVPVGEIARKDDWFDD
jgi:hypothetical protein